MGRSVQIPNPLSLFFSFPPPPPFAIVARRVCAAIQDGLALSGIASQERRPIWGHFSFLFLCFRYAGFWTSVGSAKCVSMVYFWKVYEISFFFFEHTVESDQPGLRPNRTHPRVRLAGLGVRPTRLRGPPGRTPGRTPSLVGRTLSPVGRTQKKKIFFFLTSQKCPWWVHMTSKLD